MAGLDMRALFARNLIRARTAAGITQEALAERSGLSQYYISGLEQGKRNPTIVVVHEIALALGVTHLDLLRIDEGT